MDNLPKFSNREVLKRQQWYSHKTGFIDLKTVTDEYMVNIITFWKKDRQHVMDKIKRVTFAIEKMPYGTAQRQEAIDKNKRRISVVKLFDQLISNEILKRKLN